MLVTTVDLLHEGRGQFRRLAIDCLLLGGRPAAVAWFVIAFRVRKAIDGSARWALAHVSQETLEETPARAHADAATTITLVFGVVRVGTAVEQRLPARIRRRHAAPRGVAVPGTRTTVHAPTRFRVAAAQRARHYVHEHAAGATTLPEGLALTGSTDRGHGRQLAELLPSEINCWRHARRPRRGRSQARRPYRGSACVVAGASSSVPPRRSRGVLGGRQPAMLVPVPRARREAVDHGSDAEDDRDGAEGTAALADVRAIRSALVPHRRECRPALCASQLLVDLVPPVGVEPTLSKV